MTLALVTPDGVDFEVLRQLLDRELPRASDGGPCINHTVVRSFAVDFLGEEFWKAAHWRDYYLLEDAVGRDLASRLLTTYALPKLMTYLRYKYDNVGPEDGLDYCQEVFMKVYALMRRMDRTQPNPDRKVMAYLKKAVTNWATDEGRKKQRRVKTIKETEFGREDADVGVGVIERAKNPSGGPDMIAIDRQVRESLAGLIRQEMDAGERGKSGEAVVSGILAGLSQGEVAEARGVSNARITRIKQSIPEALSRRENEWREIVYHFLKHDRHPCPGTPHESRPRGRSAASPHRECTGSWR